MPNAPTQVFKDEAKGHSVSGPDDQNAQEIIKGLLNAAHTAIDGETPSKHAKQS